jgi:deoxyribonuclease I
MAEICDPHCHRVGLGSVCVLFEVQLDELWGRQEGVLISWDQRCWFAAIIGLISMAYASTAGAQEPPQSFSQAKAILAQIHEDLGLQTTFYCGCPYVRKGSSGADIDREACGLRTYKNELRSDRVEWEHVVPASWIGRGRVCWDTGHADCQKKGRKCCAKVDDEFMSAYASPHNLFPSSGEVNGDRSAYPFGIVPGEVRNYGACDFEVGGTPKVVEPPDRVRGEIARAMLYMIDAHGVSIWRDREELIRESKGDLPEGWEIRRARAIYERTGLWQRWILGPL